MLLEFLKNDFLEMRTRTSFKFRFLSNLTRSNHKYGINPVSLVTRKKRPASPLEVVTTKKKTLDLSFFLRKITLLIFHPSHPYLHRLPNCLLPTLLLITIFIYGISMTFKKHIVHSFNFCKILGDKLS